MKCNTEKAESTEYKPLTRLIAWEQASGYKAKYVAKKLEVSPSVYSQIKQGKIKPNVKVAEKLYTEFGIDNVFELLREE